MSDNQIDAILLAQARERIMIDQLLEYVYQNQELLKLKYETEHENIQFDAQ